LLSLLLFFSLACSEDDDNPVPPIAEGSAVEIRNTLEIAVSPEEGGTGGAELSIETILGVPEGTYELNTTVSATVEFRDYLEGLYDVDLSSDAITFNLVAAADHPIYQDFFRTIEAGTFDRYYLTFPGGHGITASKSDNEAVSLDILDENQIVISIGEGWTFQPGASFAITLL